MRRLSLLLSVTLLFPAVDASAFGIVPCRVKTFVKNVRNDQKRVCRQADAGSVHVAVLSVAPWEEYVTALQPTFALSIENAMNEVLPATNTVEETMLRALAANLSAALPTATSLSTRTETLNADGTTTTTGERTRTRGSGNVDDVPAPPGGETVDFTSDKATITGTLPTDPMMRRLAALALYQEAQILSRHVSDASVPAGYEPYVVRFQVTLMPTARREPYDAYTTVTFLPGRAPVVSRMAAGTEYEKVKQGEDVGLIRVIPLLVTDNIESTRRADVSQQVRDMALSVLAMAGNTGLSAGVRSQLNRLVKSQSNDFNSLLTVARLSENSVRVRLGAIQGNGTYTMVPRTHNITVLVMAPSQSRELAYVAKASMQDAVDGTPLSTGRAGVFGWKLDDVIKPIARAYQLPEDVGVYMELLPLAQRANYAAFRSHLINEVFPDAECDSRCKLMDSSEKPEWDKAAKKERNGSPECDCDRAGIHFSAAFRDTAVDRIWAEISDYNGFAPYSEGRFALPPSLSDKRRFFPVVDVTPVDDMTGATAVRLSGGRFIDPARIRARLQVKKEGKTYHFDATAITGRSDEIELRFPSVFKLLSLGETPSVDEAKVLLSYASSTFRWEDDGPFAFSGPMSRDDVERLNSGRAVTYDAPTFIFNRKPKVAGPGFTLTAATPFVVADKNGARIRFTVRKGEGPPEKMFFSIRGADVASITPAPGLDKKQMFAADDETYEVALQNVSPLTDVIISAFSIKEKERLAVDDVRIRVLDAPQKPVEKIVRRDDD